MLYRSISEGYQSLDFADEPITIMTLPTAFLSLRAAKARWACGKLHPRIELAQSDYRRSC